MPIDRTLSARKRSAGVTIIELIVFIVIVSVALAGVLSVLNISVRSSADPMLRKQMLAIAEALMEEVSAEPFSYCDPSDANATTAGSTAGCATTIQDLGPGGTGQTRTSTANPFNNVPDYFGLATINPVSDVTNTYTYPGYSATIGIVASDVLGPAGLTIAPYAGTAATLNLLRITVTVSRTGSSDSLTLEGYRARHSPNSVP